MLNGEKVDAYVALVLLLKRASVGDGMRLLRELPQQMFDNAIRLLSDEKIIAKPSRPARKNVIAKSLRRQSISRKLPAQLKTERGPKRIAPRGLDKIRRIASWRF
jgi:translation elongation factor EF-4